MYVNVCSLALAFKYCILLQFDRDSVSDGARSASEISSEQQLVS